ncbi:uncharacterized protein LOC62_07G009710 [Vanrija pseudolonga]|uniref:Uncharacterized protein n=1 Tax=Vanrija pseudolonga TaxID=143232 RepID=A0AAF0YG18_9TREE|nr:hypothetical protein LOC62_07G009710 [Vanrija pseudolonga]
MSRNDPATYSSLKDLKQSSRTWWGGKKNSAPAAPTATAEPEPYIAPPPRSTTFEQKSRYIPPSERAPGQAMFEHVPTAAERDRDREREAKRQQSWGEWANENATWASNSVSEGYNSTFNAENRDKVLSGIGTGAAKVAGGAVKYTAKGIWAVGKAATK